MTNKQRICEICLQNGIYKKDEIQFMLDNNIEIPIHTKSVWLSKGKVIKEGMENKGIKTKLWIKQDDSDKYFLIDVVLYTKDMIENAS